MIRLKQIFSQPVVLVILFSLIIISGQSTGFFYLTLLMLGLTHGLLHSVLGIGGLILVLLSGNVRMNQVKSYIGLLGGCCMILSLIRFFTQPGASYNYPTFHQFVPLLMFLCFAISLLLFMINKLRLFKLRKNQSISPL